MLSDYFESRPIIKIIAQQKYIVKLILSRGIIRGKSPIFSPPLPVVSEVEPFIFQLLTLDFRFSIPPAIFSRRNLPASGGQAEHLEFIMSSSLRHLLSRQVCRLSLNSTSSEPFI